MKSPLRFLPLLLMPALAVAGFLLYRTLAKDSSQTSLTGIKLPPGFRIALYAGNCPGARSLAVSPAGTVFVGTIKEGAVYALTDRDRDGCADEKIVVASGLFAPNGVAFRGGSLYVAEVNRLLRYDDIEKNLHKPKPPVVLDGSFPSDTHHGWKFIAFGPDGRLYVPVGAPCNVCERSDPRYATIMRMQAAGGRPEVFAQGVRNTVGFDWHGKTGHLWFTDNGRDWLGDDIPPDELNCAPGPGLHFGFPYRWGNNVPDPDFGERAPARPFTAPALALPAHVAALGLRFYTGTMFPGAYRGRLFIAEHGSWNRSTPVGYRITTVEIDEGRPKNYSVFAEGWLSPAGVSGRPVDVANMPDGALLVSDDLKGAIYRISYGR